jgi:hypothetical protein
MMLRHRTEPDHWSPTQGEVDAYIDSLEIELSQPSVRTRPRAVKVPIKARRSDSNAPLWGMLVVVVVAYIWLVQMLAP